MCHFMSKCDDWEGLVGIWSPTQRSVALKDCIRDIITLFFVEWEDVDVSSIFIQINILSSGWMVMKPAFKFFGSSLISSSGGNRSDGPAAEASCSLDLFDPSQTGSRCYSGSLRSPICAVQPNDIVIVSVISASALMKHPISNFFTHFWAKVPELLI